MPTVPNNVVAFNGPQRAQPKVDDTYLMMAASDLHDAGRLFESSSMIGENELEQPQKGRWTGSQEDQQRAMNLLRRKSTNEPIDKDASEWLDGYMKWQDRTLPPIDKMK